MTVFSTRITCAVVVSTLLAAPVSARQAAGQPGNGNGNGTAASNVTLPSNYVIGPEDVLSVVVWREKDMSVDAVVRPDGKISLPLLNDVTAAGLTPEALRLAIAKDAAKFVKDLRDSDVTVVVKEIKSRKVSITGQVAKSSTYDLTTGMTVLQLIALAGGLLEYADASNIVVMRKEDGRDRAFKFNYKDVIKGKDVQQNILLKPGDIVVVP